MIRENLFCQLRHVLILLVFGTLVSGCSSKDSHKDGTKTRNLRSESINSRLPNTRVSQRKFVRGVKNSFGSFVVPGITLSRWNRSKDIVAWTDTNQPLVRIESPNGDIIHDIGVSKNGAFMASVGAQINIWNLDTLSLIRSWELDSIAREIILTPSGEKVISVHEDNSIRIWQQETGFNIAVLKHSRSISAVAISDDGSRIASADTGGSIFIWDTVTGRKLHKIDNILRINALQFSKDGRRLASSGISSSDVNYTVQIWETRFYSLEMGLPGHRSVVNSVAFSPDGKYLTTASRDNTIKVWDLKRGSLLRTFRGHTDDVVKTVLSQDGNWLISSALNDRVRIWSFPTGRTIQSFNVPYLRSKSLEYISNRNWILVVGGGNQDIQIWASSGFTYRPWGDIQKKVARQYKDMQKTPSIPFVPKPQLPSLSNLRKDPFESQILFINRAARVYGPRINRQIVQYRRKVDKRNKKVAILRQNERDSHTLINSQVRRLAVNTTKKTLGKTVLFPLTIEGRPAYDPDKQLMKIRVSFSRAYYREDFVLAMPQGTPAKLFYKDLTEGRIVGQSIFDFISESRVRLSQVNIRWRGRNFIARPTRLSSGNQVVVPSILLETTRASQRLQFQRYGIPYTNFSDFIRAILREQIKNDIEAQNKKQFTVNPETQRRFPNHQKKIN